MHNFFIIIPIALLNWLYFITIQKPDNLDYSFFQFILMTTAVGIFPSGFFIYYFELKLRRKNQHLADKVNQQIELNSPSNSKIESLNFNAQKTSINVKLDNFICVKSMGNYVTLYFMEENRLKKEIIRSTMKKIEDDFLENSRILRCHKSYLVNLDKVVSTSGNARALYFHINELNFQIPISRNYSKDFVLKTI